MLKKIDETSDMAPKINQAASSKSEVKMADKNDGSNQMTEPKLSEDHAPVKKTASKAKSNFHEAYVDEHPDMPTEKSTGRVFAAASAIIGGIIYYYSDYTNTTALIIGLWLSAAFLLMAEFKPLWLRPLNILWFKFSMLLFKIVNPLIMALLFVVLFIPAGLIMQLRLDPLGRKRDPEAKSYWVEKTDDTTERSMKNQF